MVNCNLLLIFVAHVALALASPATGRSIERIYDVKLRPPVLRNVGDTHLPACVGLLRHEERETKTFLMPRFESVSMLVLGDSTLRFEFQSPSGKRFVPGETPDHDGFQSGGLRGFQFLSFERPEPGRWSVTAEASGLRDTATYGIVISTSDSVEEQPHLEAFGPDSDPRFDHPVEPGTVLYVRAFVLHGERPLPGVQWSIHVKTSKDSLLNVPVFDDGLHADGAASDGVYVGAVRAEGPDGLYHFLAEALTPEGVRYAATSMVQVQAKYDLLVAGDIAVSSDPQVGQPVTLTVTVKNDGARDYQDVKLDLDVTLVDGRYRDRWTEEASRQQFGLRAGESRRVSVRWTPSRPGDYEAQLTIDLDIEPHDIDYGNNWRMVRVTVR